MSIKGNNLPKDSNKTYVERLKEKLSAEADIAMPLALARNFDAAEQMIRAIDSDIYGWLAMARMY
jgi:hypothetical protein